MCLEKTKRYVLCFVPEMGSSYRLARETRKELEKISGLEILVESPRKEPKLGIALPPENVDKVRSINGIVYVRKDSKYDLD